MTPVEKFERIARVARPMKRDMLPTVDGVPPNYGAIVAVLPDASADGVMFAYGDKVYGRGIAKQLTRELDAHERVHLKRQAGDPEWWWKHYLADPGFRYYEEVLAHQAEYDTYCSRHANQIKRYQALRKMATRLASPLYGAGVTVEQAMLDIRYSPGDLPRATAKLPNKPIEFV